METAHGIGCQPMVRELLHRFARAELNAILTVRLDALTGEQAQQQGSSPAGEFLSERRRA